MSQIEQQEFNLFHVSSGNYHTAKLQLGSSCWDESCQDLSEVNTGNHHIYLGVKIGTNGLLWKQIYTTIFNPFNIKQHISAYYLSPFWTFNIKQHYLHIRAVVQSPWFSLAKKAKRHRIPMDLPSTSQRGSARCKVPDVPDVDVDVDVALPRRGGRAGAPFAGKRLGGNPKEKHGFPKMICISGGILWVFYSHVNVYRNGTMFNLL